MQKIKDWLKELTRKISLKRSMSIGISFLVIIGLILTISLFSSSEEEAISSQSSKKILYWIDPMEPHIHYEGPGKSRMNMDTVPVYEEDEQQQSSEESSTTIKISPAVVNNLGVRTAMVEEGPINLTINSFGSIKADESKISHIHVYVEGWIRKLQTKKMQETVEKGQPLFEIYSRDLLLAQKEYLLEIRNKEKTKGASSISKLKALGVSDKQIEELKKTQQANSLVTIFAPEKGYIDSLNIREGMWVKPETTIMSITDLSTVWVIAEVFPNQIPLIKSGQDVRVYLPHSSEKSWSGKVDYIYPAIDPVSLTVKVRIILDNPGYLFKPHMYVAVEFEGPTKQAISIPSEAVIWDNGKARVIVALEGGKFQPRQVTTGIESSSRIEILSGLIKGEKVVTSAQFLLDSEIHMKSALQRLEDPATASPPAHTGHSS